MLRRSLSGEVASERSGARRLGLMGHIYLGLFVGERWARLARPMSSSLRRSGAVVRDSARPTAYGADHILGVTPPRRTAPRLIGAPYLALVRWPTRTRRDRELCGRIG